jgi:hypothetical protein
MYFNYRWNKVIDQVIVMINKKPILLSIAIARIKTFNKVKLWNFQKNRRKKIFKLFFFNLGFSFVKNNNIVNVYKFLYKYNFLKIMKNILSKKNISFYKLKNYLQKLGVEWGDYRFALIKFVIKNQIKEFIYNRIFITKLKVDKLYIRKNIAIYSCYDNNIYYIFIRKYFFNKKLIKYLLNVSRCKILNFSIFKINIKNINSNESILIKSNCILSIFNRALSCKFKEKYIIGPLFLKKNLVVLFNKKKYIKYNFLINDLNGEIIKIIKNNFFLCKKIKLINLIHINIIKGIKKYNYKQKLINHFFSKVKFNFKCLMGL